jgi:hypothetical protein
VPREVRGMQQYSHPPRGAVEGNEYAAELADCMRNEEGGHESPPSDGTCSVTGNQARHAGLRLTAKHYQVSGVRLGKAADFHPGNAERNAEVHSMHLSGTEDILIQPFPKLLLRRLVFSTLPCGCANAAAVLLRS